MVKSICLVLLWACISLCIIQVPCYAQNQNNIWYFGDGAGLDFNTDPPTVLTDGSLYSSEAAAVISDRNTGQVLFYSDGVSVWNANHDTMPNGTGLMGCQSSTQGALIVPNPGSNFIYYLFTLDCGENNFNGGLRYSIIDLTLDNNLGDVVTKDVLLHAPMTEKLVGITHENGIDFWILAHEWGSNSFYAYRMDCNGIDTVPVISQIGYFPTTNVEGIGYLQVSPNGQRLASVTYDSIELFDFDNTTGVVSNVIVLPANATVEFGAAFSPDNSKLYVTIDGVPNGKIYQYDLSTNDSATIASSQNVIASSSTEFFSSVQLAPDNKIYVVNRPMNQFNDSALGIINYPDSLGMACNFIADSVHLMGKTAERCLPNFIFMDYDTVVVQPTSSFTYSTSLLDVTFIDASTDNNGWLWIYGDGNTDTVQNPVHSYDSMGTYNVCLVVSNNCGSDTLCDSVTVNTVGIHEDPRHAIIDIYPNPTSGTLHMELPENQEALVEIVSLLGVVYYSKIYEPRGSNASKLVELNLPDQISSGIYHVLVSTSHTLHRARIVIP